MYDIVCHNHTWFHSLCTYLMLISALTCTNYAAAASNVLLCVDTILKRKKFNLSLSSVRMNCMTLETQTLLKLIGGYHRYHISYNGFSGNCWRLFIDEIGCGHSALYRWSTQETFALNAWSLLLILPLIIIKQHYINMVSLHNKYYAEQTKDSRIWFCYKLLRCKLNNFVCDLSLPKSIEGQHYNL